ncbi:hypothetical protein IU421_30015 [Nocardia cyriacigeorgica]|uniref:hypothetical protein n=1 Tax=Nocardia cyriacigeorgica TaxID=135487 RepID=UPI0018938A3A|nr:hypothetical protein [Nocardia cyriacigeorgica]MBF6518482.1 hypothetical protein [Nocardia cyriacigeorgica]
MPKSKGRKPKSATARRTTGRPRRRSNGYNPGALGIPVELIAKMLATAPPDQLVEMLPPMLWLHHSSGMQANLCVSAAITLHHAYDLIGITSRPTAVDLAISHRTRGPLTRYGAGGPTFDPADNSFNGHCVLWLPGSGRWVDATVMQYPEARASMPLPIIGRIGTSFGGSPAALEEFTQGRLVPGTHMAVPREELLLDYTVLAADDDFLAPALDHDPVIAASLRSSGINLASAAIEWWRRPGIIERVRQAPYPRLHALLDTIGQAPVHRDDTETWFFETEPGHLDRLPAASHPPRHRGHRLIKIPEESPDPAVTSDVER